MQKFSRVVTCAKCCSDIASRKYRKYEQARREFDSQWNSYTKEEIPEHIEVTCSNCSYKWQMECADANN